jgi:hypothetical protein
MMEQALDNFISKKVQLDVILRRLQTLSDNHFMVDPDEVSWGDVSDVGNLLEKLTQATESIFALYPETGE